MSATGPLPPESTASDLTGPQLRFFQAAFALLAEEGYGALKQANLCRRAGVTTGSFYHSFENWQAFTEALLAHWERERTTYYGESARAEPDPSRRLDLLIRAALDLPHGSESAIRTWAGADPAVAEIQQRVDTARLVTVRDAMLAALGEGEDEHADRLARAAFYLLVGFEQSRVDDGPDALAWALRLVRAQIDAHVAARGDDGRGGA